MCSSVKKPIVYRVEFLFWNKNFVDMDKETHADIVKKKLSISKMYFVDRRMIMDFDNFKPHLDANYILVHISIFKDDQLIFFHVANTLKAYHF